MKKFISILLVLSMVFGMSTLVFAGTVENTSVSLGNVTKNDELSKKIEVIEVKEDFETSELLSNIGKVSYKVALRIDDGDYNLYPTFDNITEAIDNISTQCRDIFKEMEELYQLEKFSANTANGFYEYMPAYIENQTELYDSGAITENDYEKNLEQVNLFESFWDIYENETANFEITTKVKKLGDKITRATTQTAIESILTRELDALRIMMPYNTGGAEKIESYKAEFLGLPVETCSYSGNSQFVVNNGVSYAETYGGSPNTVGYGLLSQDCTNFVSQIKHEGGVPFYKTVADSDGWNLKMRTVGTSVLPKFDYSVRWVNADKFVKFFGVKSKYSAQTLGRYKAFVNFASAIKKGSFIAYDKEADGSWNHNGFVTYLWHQNETSRRNISYHGTTYKDFKVAQHSNHYHAWTSSSNNGWETIPEDNSNVVFAIVN